VLHTYPSEMAQNFWTAIFSWSACFGVTILVSLLTRAPDEARLVGLVHTLTPKPEDSERRFWMRPAILGALVLAGALALNILFR
jgi:SSS family solute:Na+ symporter